MHPHHRGAYMGFLSDWKRVKYENKGKGLFSCENKP